MINLGFREYFRNFWYNFFTIVILAIMIISSVILISTINNQTKVYRYAKPYLGTTGEVVGTISKEYIDKLKSIDKIMYSKNVFLTRENVEYGEEIINTIIYDKRMESFLKPIISEGRWVKNGDGDKDTIYAVVSENRSDIKVGDTIQVYFVGNAGEKEEKNVYICGKLLEGQRIYNGSEMHLDSNMSVRDLFNIYSFEQTQNIMLLTTNRQISKFDTNMDSLYTNVIIKYDKNISKMDKEYNEQVIGENNSNLTNGIEAYAGNTISMKELADRSGREEKNAYITYIPLIAVDFMLICVCIMGISAVKTARSTKYYGKLYLCGMKWTGGIHLSAFEIALNCILAIILSMIMIEIHNKYYLFGKVFANLEIVQVIVIAIMCLITVFVSICMTGKILKNNSPMEILRENSL